ncbi:prohibitin-like protein, putative [Plasmodium ovale curtisi]|uniref:Prohibitin-like protein, putative n=1 Tax=Plasmodium ovale curtisi TaxID=864141 RepID=A0A1A8VKY8_PLAOA|nr:prohibitin-like protein, putative [Plasmodium ovale curtisi]
MHVEKRAILRDFFAGHFGSLFAGHFGSLFASHFLDHFGRLFERLFCSALLFDKGIIKMKRHLFGEKFYANCNSLGRTFGRSIHCLVGRNIHVKNERLRKRFTTDNAVNGIKKYGEGPNLREVNLTNKSPHVEVDDDALSYRNVITGNEDVTSSSKIKLRSLKNFNLAALCLITSLFFYFTMKKVPEGYICLVQNKNDLSVLPYIYDDLMTFFFNPLKYKIILMRIIPIQKKYLNVYETRDKKKIKVKLEVKMKPKIPFIIDIYSSFGINYSSNYIEREMNFDIKNVVKNYNFDTLLNGKEESRNFHEITADDVVDQIMDRFFDCSVFHKIVLLDVSIVFSRVDEGI